MPVTTVKRFLSTTALVSMLATGSIASDFDTDTPSIYVDDAANRAMMLPRILACIMDQAGVGSDDRLTNATWSAMVDEKKCDLAESDSATFATAVMQSERLTATSDQEITGWMDTSEGDKMIMSAVLTQAPSAEDPFGRYSVSFYLANPDETLIEASDLTEDTEIAMYGYAYVYAEGSDIVIDAFMLDDAMDNMEMRTRAVVVDGNPDNVRYAFEIDAEFMSVNALGATNAEKSFRYLMDNTGQIIGAECTSRTKIWQNTWEMALYESDTGERFQLPNPSIAFDTENGRYGDVNADWFWIEGDERYSLNPDNPEMVITPIGNSDDKTLVWAPSDLRVAYDIPYTPTNGDTLQYGYWDSSSNQSVDVEAVFNTDGFYYDAGGTPQRVPSDRNAWSQQYNMEVYIGEDANGNQTFVGKGAKTAIPKPNDGLFYDGTAKRDVANAAKLYCVGWGCSDINLGITSGEMLTLMQDNGGNLPWNAFRSSEVGRNDNSVFTYFLAPLDLPSESPFIGGALYHDDNDNGSLDAFDKPVMFNFRMDWDENKAIYNWDGTPNEALTAALQTANIGWVGHYFDLVSAETCSDVATAGNNAYDVFESCNKITYHHNTINGHGYVRNADGSYYDFSDPLTLKLVDFDPEFDDRNFNYAQDALALGTLPQLGTVKDGDWNPLTGRSCDVTTWENEFEALTRVTLSDYGLGLTYVDDDSVEYCLVPVAPDYYVGKTLYFTYDGRALHGVNGVQNVEQERWYQMVNLESGVELVDVNDSSKVYKVKPVAIDEYLHSLTSEVTPFGAAAVTAAVDACEVDSPNEQTIVFNPAGTSALDLTMLGMLDEMPPTWFNEFYVKPTVNWSERPNATPESNCFVKNKEVICPAN